MATTRKTPKSGAEIGRRLRALRDERGMTQVQLADAMGIHQTNLSQMERGVRGMGTQQVMKACKALGVSPDRLLAAAGTASAKSPRNTRLLRRVHQVEQLPTEHQEAVVRMLDAFLDTHSSNGRR